MTDEGDDDPGRQPESEAGGATAGILLDATPLRRAKLRLAEWSTTVRWPRTTGSGCTPEEARRGARTKHGHRGRTRKHVRTMRELAAALHRNGLSRTCWSRQPNRWTSNLEARNR